MRHMAWVVAIATLFTLGCYHSTGVQAPISIISQVDDNNAAEFIGESPKTMAANGDFYISNNKFDMIVDGGIVGERRQNFLAPTGGSIIDITSISVNNLLQRNSFNNDNLNQIFQIVNANLGTPVAYTSIRIQALSDNSSSIKMSGYVMDRDGSLAAAGLAVDPDTLLVASLPVETVYTIDKNADFLVMTTTIRNEGNTTAPVATVGDFVFLGGNSMRAFVPAPGFGYCPKDGTDLPVFVPYVTFEEHVPPYETFGFYAPDDGVIACTFDGGDLAYERSGGRYLTVNKPYHVSDTLAAGDTITFVRHLLPRLSPSQYTAAFYIIDKLLGIRDNPRNYYTETGQISGVINYNINQKNFIVTAEQIIPGTYFNGDQFVSSPIPVPLAAARTSESGGYNFQLPPGRYQLRVNGHGVRNYLETTYTVIDPGDPNVDGDETSTEVPIDITAGKTISAGEITLYSPLTGKPVAVSKDQSGQIIPSRVSLFPADGGDPVILESEEGGEFGALNHYFLYYGRREIKLRQGSIRMVFSHGPLFDVVDKTETITQGEDENGNVVINLDPQEVAATLDRVVDPGNYRSFDPVIRTSSSYNCSINAIERMMSVLAEGVDVVMTADVNVIPDLKDFISAMEGRYRNETQDSITIDPEIVHVITGATVKNFIPGDLLPHGFGEYAIFPLVRTRGIRGFGVGNTGDRRFATVFDNLQNRSDIPLTAILLNPRGTDELPNGIVSGLFTSMEQPVPADLDDPYFSGQSELGTGTTNDAFQLIEVLAGNRYDEYLQTRLDWFGMLNAGHLKWGCGGSGYLANAPHFPGSPRTWVQVTGDTYDEAAFIASFAAGHSFVSTGPFLDVTVGGQAPGATVPGTGGTVTLSIRVQAPGWIPVEELRVIVDGEVVHSESLAAQTGVTRYSGTLTVPVGTSDGFIVVECGASLANLAAGILPGGTFNEVYPDIQPIAFTNPFLVDRDGDGAWHGN